MVYTFGTFLPVFTRKRIRAVIKKFKNRMANSVDPDEMTHLNLHCLHRHLCSHAGL